MKRTHTFDDAISTVELLFVDINMPDIAGIDLVHSLQRRPLVIFTTAHKQFASEGFKLDAVDYLLKPIGFEYRLVKIPLIISKYIFQRQAHIDADVAEESP